jgi:hypothetical protein
MGFENRTTIVRAIDASSPAVPNFRTHPPASRHDHVSAPLNASRACGRAAQKVGQTPHVVNQLILSSAKIPRVGSADDIRSFSRNPRTRATDDDPSKLRSPCARALVFVDERSSGCEWGAQSSPARSLAAAGQASERLAVGSRLNASRLLAECPHGSLVVAPNLTPSNRKCNAVTAQGSRNALISTGIMRASRLPLSRPCVLFVRLPAWY